MNGYLKDSHLVKILCTFTKPELRSFGRLVNSPYFNTSSQTTLLYGEIKKFYPRFAGAEFTREKLFAKIYPGKKFSKDLMNRLVSNLIALAEEFILLNSNPYRKQNLLLGLRKRKLHSLFLSEYSKIQKKNKFNLFAAEEIQQQILTEEEYGDYFLDTDKYRMWDIQTDLSMEYHLIRFLYKAAQVFRQKTFLNTNKDSRTNVAYHLETALDLTGLLEQVRGSDIKNKEIISHYISLVMLNSAKDKKLYEEIKKYISGNPLINETKDIYIGYIYLLDFLSHTLKLVKGDERIYYLNEKKIIYKEIERVYFATGRIKMLFAFFRNFILSGINTHDLEWCEYVLNKYLPQILEKGNESVGKYYEALILFHKGRYSESMDKLSFFKSDKFVMDKDVHFYDIRILRFMLYYELNFHEEALSLAETFMYQLKKSRNMPASHRSSAESFIKNYKKIILYVLNNDKDSLKVLAEKIDAERSYSGREWLLNKTKEISEENKKGAN